jgi:hypothetical protein
MAFVHRSFKIQGVSALIMHNVRLADKMDPFTKEVARLVPKAKKSDEEALAMGTVEWCGGLYHTPGDIEISDGVVKWDKDIRVIIPAKMIKACLVKGAAKSRKGTVAKGSVIVGKDALLEYDGPKDLNKLMRDSRFVLRELVQVRSQRVMRVRPVFRKWSATIELEIDTETMDLEVAYQALIDAGRYCGRRARLGLVG